MKKRKVTQLCLTLYDPMDCCLPDSSVHGIFQARILEWVAISCLGRWILYHPDIWEAQGPFFQPFFPKTKHLPLPTPATDRACAWPSFPTFFSATTQVASHSLLRTSCSLARCWEQSQWKRHSPASTIHDPARQKASEQRAEVDAKAHTPFRPRFRDVYFLK